jgi:SAM-dependent methyltransferase
MSAIKPPTLLTLDPPYRLDRTDKTHVFLGWAEVEDYDAPDIQLSINGAPVRVFVTRDAAIEAAVPDRAVRPFYASVDFAQLLSGQPAVEPFLLEATLSTDGRGRTFEYEVTEAWLQAVFGRPLRPRRIPPPHLQVRVTGAAAGGYHNEGHKVALQIADILAAGGYPLERARSILDFGCGPGRVISSIADMIPGARLFGSDIDAEAIAWAQTNLGDIGDFRVNDPEPPLPFADESFDLVYSISIFTHLPEELQWGMLSELRRVLKPGGILLTTKLNPAAYDLPDDVKAEGLERGFTYWGDAAATEGLPGFYRLAYHTQDYVEREWGRYFEVLHVGAHDLNNTQDAVLLRRPRHALSWLPSPVRKKLHGLKAGVAAVG